MKDSDLGQIAFEMIKISPMLSHLSRDDFDDWYKTKLSYVEVKQPKGKGFSLFSFD